MCIICTIYKIGNDVCLCSAPNSLTCCFVERSMNARRVKSVLHIKPLISEIGNEMLSDNSSLMQSNTLCT